MASEQEQYHEGIQGILDGLINQVESALAAHDAINQTVPLVEVMMERYRKAVAAVTAVVEYHERVTIPTLQAMHVSAGSTQQKFHEAFPTTKGRPGLQRIAAGLAELVQNSNKTIDGAADAKGEIDELAEDLSGTNERALGPLTGSVESLVSRPSNSADQNLELREQVRLQRGMT